MIREGDAVICMLEVEQGLRLLVIPGLVRKVFYDFGWVYYEIKLS